jgi:AcrR family transcriptional regulator
MDETRLRLVLDAAEEEFASCGYERASFNQILEKAKLSKGVMYHHFENKAALFRAVVLRAQERFVSELGTWQPSNDAIDFRNQFENIGHRFIQIAGQDPSAFRLLKLAIQAPEALEQAVAKFRHDALAWTIRVLEDGQHVGAVRSDVPLDLLACAALGLGQGMDAWMLGQLAAIPTDFPPEQLEANMSEGLKLTMRLFFDFLAPREQARESVSQQE